MQQTGGALGRVVWRIVGIAFAIAVFAALFVIWWLALLIGLVALAIWAVRRMLAPASAAPKSGSTTIEGEFTVEPEPRSASADPSDRIPPRLPPGR